VPKPAPRARPPARPVSAADPVPAADPARPVEPEFSPARRLAVWLLLAAGTLVAAASWACQDADAAPGLGMSWGVGRWTLAAVVAAGVGVAAAVVPAAGNALAAAHAAVANPSPRRRAGIALGVGVAAFAYLVLTAHLQGRDLFPKTHDEQAYWLQARMLAAGRLWLPPHPLADFFDTFYVLARPVYASQYFVGAALLYAPAALLGLPTWLLPAGVAAAVVALVYRVVAELVDGAAGLLAAGVVVSLGWFRVYSVLVTGHEPLLLLGLLTTWAWLRWRAAGGTGAGGDVGRGRRWPWATLVGAFAGWAAITRPADAVCFALPVGAGMLLDLVRPCRREKGTEGRGTWSLKRPRPDATVGRFGRPVLPACAATAGLLVAGATPFLILQVVCNVGVTGRPLDTPFALYARQDMPGVGYGGFTGAAAAPTSAAAPTAAVASVVPQKRDFYPQFVAPYVRRHQDAAALAGWWGRVYLPMTADTALPGRPCVAFLPAGLVLLRGRRRLAVAAVLPLFVLALVPYTFFLEHYAIVVIPATLLLLVLGVKATAMAAGPRLRRPVGAALSAGLVALCVASLPEAGAAWGEGRQAVDETFPSAFMRAAHAVRADAPDAVRRPAVVLFRYRSGDPLSEEPVYNTDAAWPDDCPVIYAHDLGDRNGEIVRYYADRQPDRTFYRWDRRTGETEELGRADDLATRR
jgi:hypothetical protein